MDVGHALQGDRLVALALRAEQQHPISVVAGFPSFHALINLQLVVREQLVEEDVHLVPPEHEHVAHVGLDGVRDGALVRGQQLVRDPLRRKHENVVVRQVKTQVFVASADAHRRCPRPAMEKAIQPFATMSIQPQLCSAFVVQNHDGPTSGVFFVNPELEVAVEKRREPTLRVLLQDSETGQPSGLRSPRRRRTRGFA